MFNIDYEAQNIYPADAPSNLLPAMVAGNGNCLFRSFSVIILGDETIHVEMRPRASVQLICNLEYYICEEQLFPSHTGQAIYWTAHYPDALHGWPLFH